MNLTVFTGSLQNRTRVDLGVAQLGTWLSRLVSMVPLGATSTHLRAVGRGGLLGLLGALRSGDVVEQRDARSVFSFSSRHGELGDQRAHLDTAQLAREHPRAGELLGVQTRRSRPTAASAAPGSAERCRG